MCSLYSMAPAIEPAERRNLFLKLIIMLVFALLSGRTRATMAGDSTASTAATLESVQSLSDQVRMSVAEVGHTHLKKLCLFTFSSSP